MGMFQIQNEPEEGVVDGQVRVGQDEHEVTRHYIEYRSYVASLSLNLTLAEQPLR